MIDAKIKAKDYMVDALVQYKIKKAEKIAYDNAPQSLNQGAVSFSTTAAKIMPPPKDGSKGLKIADELYQRKIFAIHKLLKNPKFKKHQAKFIAQLRNGNRFVVCGYKDRGKHQTFFYAKTYEEAKQNFGRIKYRGLYKWLWGSNFDSIGEKTPIAFRRLLQKSPSLIKQKDLASMKLQKKEFSIAVVSEYFADGIEYFARLAERKALRSSMNKIKSFINKKIKKEIKDV